MIRPPARTRLCPCRRPAGHRPTTAEPADWLPCSGSRRRRARSTQHRSSSIARANEQASRRRGSRSAPIVGTDRAGRDTAERSPAQDSRTSQPQSTGRHRGSRERRDRSRRSSSTSIWRRPRLYMQQGRYYRAADSFRLASVYIPHDPAAAPRQEPGPAGGRRVRQQRRVSGQGHRARRPVRPAEGRSGGSPRRARSCSCSGSRISRRRPRAADAPQLQFLLAYVYFQMDQPDEARSARSTAARNGLPPPPPRTCWKRRSRQPRRTGVARPDTCAGVAAPQSRTGYRSAWHANR